MNDSESDPVAQEENLRQEEKVVQAWLNHPLGTQFSTSLREEEEQTIEAICDMQITSFASFFAHFQLLGHLTGVRRSRQLLHQRADEISEELQNQ